MKNEEFTAPELEIYMFNSQDIVTTSSFDDSEHSFEPWIPIS